MLFNGGFLMIVYPVYPKKFHIGLLKKKTILLGPGLISSDFPFGCAFCLKDLRVSTILKAMPMLASTVLGSPKGDREIQVGYMKGS